MCLCFCLLSTERSGHPDIHTRLLFCLSYAKGRICTEEQYKCCDTDICVQNIHVRLLERLPLVTACNHAVQSFKRQMKRHYAVSIGGMHNVPQGRIYAKLHYMARHANGRMVFRTAANSGTSESDLVRGITAEIASE